MSPTLPPEVIERRLAEWPVARLATLRPGGAPHLVPVVFAYSDGAFWIPDDGKPKRDARLERIRNLEADPRVCLLLDEYREDWTALWWIRVDGSARLCAADVGGDAERAAARLVEKYPQYRETPPFRGAPQFIRIEPESRRAWSARDA